jgi:hypothetical protein
MISRAGLLIFLLLVGFVAWRLNANHEPTQEFEHVGRLGPLKTDSAGRPGLAARKTKNFSRAPAETSKESNTGIIEDYIADPERTLLVLRRSYAEFREDLMGMTSVNFKNF